MSGIYSPRKSPAEKEVAQVWRYVQGYFSCTRKSHKLIDFWQIKQIGAAEVSDSGQRAFSISLGFCNSVCMFPHKVNVYV